MWLMVLLSRQLILDNRGGGLRPPVFIMVTTTYTPEVDSNTTTTPLSAGAEWLGEWRRVPFSKTVQVNVKSDANGVLYFQFSNHPDGTNPSNDPPSGYHCRANELESHAIRPTEPYFRARYVNGDTSQTSFELYTYYNEMDISKLDPLDKVLGRSEDAMPTRPSDPQDEVVRGLKDGVTFLNKWGYRDDVDTSDGDALIIANNSTNTPTILTTATTFDIAYNNSLDGSTSTGALSILFTYIDANEELQTATHVLGSSGSDTTSFSGLGINKCILASSGSNDTNGGDITITATTGGSVQSFIPADSGVAQNLLGHIPANTVGVAKFIFLSGLRPNGEEADGGPRITFKLFSYNRATGTRYEVFRHAMNINVEATMALNNPINFDFSPRDVFWVTADTDTNNVSVEGRVSLNLYETN